MPNAFEILAGFLDRFDTEVEGREVQEPPVELQNKLKALAQGSLSEAERAEVFAQLNRNPAWVARLADEVKTLRSKTNAKGGGSSA